MNEANPQRENGHTDIANEIVDKFCQYRISGEEWIVLWVVIRKTYGWHKKEDFISLTQFQQMTGLKRPHIIRAIKKLVSKKVLHSTKNDTTTPNMYRFNKHLHEWISSTKKDTTLQGSTNKDNGGSTNKGNRVVPIKVHTKETIQKKLNTQKKEIPIIPLPDFVDKELWEGYVDMRKSIKKPLTDFAIKRAIKKLEEFYADGEDVNKILDRAIIANWQGLFSLKDKGGTDGRKDTTGKYSNVPVLRAEDMQ